jgi:hypothetical protein
MKFISQKNRENISGRIPLVLLWLIGVPVPILIRTYPKT